LKEERENLNITMPFTSDFKLPDSVHWNKSENKSTRLEERDTCATALTKVKKTRKKMLSNTKPTDAIGCDSMSHSVRRYHSAQREVLRNRPATSLFQSSVPLAPCPSRSATGHILSREEMLENILDEALAICEEEEQEDGQGNHGVYSSSTSNSNSTNGKQ
jgi:hypothetical protein